jgi:hypothetical protein
MTRLSSRRSQSQPLALRVGEFSTEIKSEL